METKYDPPRKVKAIVVLSLPTRDGNATSMAILGRTLPSFKPTYKGWKPALPGLPIPRTLRFKPTYKGWKLIYM